jgi:uncharacterized membrane protein
VIDLIGKLPTPLDLPMLRGYFISPKNKSFGERRKIIALSIAGLGDAAFVLLRQTGIMKRLPDLSPKIFDANQVTVSEKAFDLGLPDAALSIVGYGAILTLATWGGGRDLYRKRWMDRALVTVVMINGLAAGQYFLNMVFRQKKICLYCITGAAINFSLLKPAWKEMRQ